MIYIKKKKNILINKEEPSSKVKYQLQTSIIYIFKSIKAHNNILTKHWN